MPAEPEEPGAPETPRAGCAASEARDDADRAISALLWRAGELKQRLEHPDTDRGRPSAFQGALEEFLARTDEDPGLSGELDLLVRMLGQGTALQLLFQELFQPPNRPVALSLRTDRRTDLSEREREVLAEMAKGLRTDQIAEHLDIDVGTVRKHQSQIYAKLLVDAVDDLPADRAWSAVTLGELLGLTPPSLSERLELQREAFELSLDYFAGVLVAGAERARELPNAAGLSRLAALGALLLCLSPATGMFAGWSGGWREPGTHLLFEFTPHGKLLRSWDGEGRLWRPYALTFVPPAAAAHGFPPGNVLISEHHTQPNTLNVSSVLLLDRNGRYAGRFTGGEYLSTRLVGSPPVAFTPDGKLLAGSQCHTDTVLEFTEGGRRVERRISGITAYGNGLTVDRSGNVYVAGGTERESAVQVYDARGQPLRKIGRCHMGGYQDLAIDSQDRLYVANQPEGRIDVYRLSGEALAPVRQGGLQSPHRLALDPNPSGMLYVLEGSHQQVRVYDTRGGLWLRDFETPPGTYLTDLCADRNGTLFAVGWRE